MTTYHTHTLRKGESDMSRSLLMLNVYLMANRFTRNRSAAYCSEHIVRFQSTSENYTYFDPTNKDTLGWSRLWLSSHFSLINVKRFSIDSIAIARCVRHDFLYAPRLASYLKRIKNHNQLYHQLIFN